MVDEKKSANFLSYVLSPTMIAFYIILIFLLYPPIEQESHIIVDFILSFIFLCIFPVVTILYFYRKGTVDIWVSNQKQRAPFYLIAIIGYVIASLIFFLRNDTTLFVLSVAYVAVTLSVTISNFATKVSSHSAGVAGPLTAITLVYGLIALPSFLLLPLVFWARLIFNSHSVLQLLYVSFIGILVTFFVYILLFPLRFTALI